MVMRMRLRIRDLREDKDIPQKQVATYLMCDQSLYSKYERGERPVPLEIIVNLAEYYGTTVDYLVGLTDEGGPGQGPRKYEKVRLLREEAGITREQAARLFHIPLKVYEGYENGSRPIPAQALCVMADHYKVSVDYLLGRTSRKTPYEK